LVVMDTAMTGRDTPQARPSAALDGTNTYATFCAAASRGHRVCWWMGKGGWRLGHAHAEDSRCKWPMQAATGAHLVLRQKGKVQKDLDGLRVGCHDHELGDASVQGLGGCSTGNAWERMSAAAAGCKTCSTTP
jgi:hypothetical protein